jgi:outer membrane protein assembly factor BamB
VSDTARDVGGNHHAVAAGRIDGRPFVFAPVSGEGGTDRCALVGLDGRNGSVRWQQRVPPANCTIHSVADPTIADADADGTAEIVAATTERVVSVYDPLTGAPEARHALSSYGYTKPLVTDVTGDGRPELLVVDVKGSAVAVRANGTTLWSHRHDTYTWGQPAVADFDGDRDPELVTALGSGDLYLYDGATGRVEWTRSLDDDPTGIQGAVTWLTTKSANAGSGTDIVVATDGGTVALLDGEDGAQQWRHGLGAFAAVHAVGDGDGDGRIEIYAVAKDGVLRSLNASTGHVEWSTTLTPADVQMMPPPALGDVTGDGAPELVAPTHDGEVLVVDPASGHIQARYGRGEAIWTHPTLADLNDDGSNEILTVYGNGEVVALDAPLDT